MNHILKLLRVQIDNFICCRYLDQSHQIGRFMRSIRGTLFYRICRIAYLVKASLLLDRRRLCAVLIDVLERIINGKSPYSRLNSPILDI